MKILVVLVHSGVLTDVVAVNICRLLLEGGVLVATLLLPDGEGVDSFLSMYRNLCGVFVQDCIDLTLDCFVNYNS